MPINNFEKCARHMDYLSTGETFYFLQILKRRKDNPGMDKDMKVIDNIFIKDKEDLEKKMPEIIDNCNKHNARAYLRLNIRNLEKVALLAVKKSMEYIIDGNYKAVKGAFWSAAGDVNSQPCKRWIVDIDVKSEIYVADVISYIQELQKDMKKPYIVEGVIPTVNGFHIISNPFNRDEFGRLYPDVDIHTDNPTILYVP